MTKLARAFLITIFGITLLFPLRSYATRCPTKEQERLRAVTCTNGGLPTCLQVKALDAIGDLIAHCQKNCSDCTYETNSVKDSSGPGGNGLVNKGSKVTVPMNVGLGGSVIDVTITANEDINSNGEYTIGSPQVSSNPSIPVTQNTNVLFFFSKFKCTGSC